jgi:hypothetical protein
MALLKLAVRVIEMGGVVVDWKNTRSERPNTPAREALFVVSRSLQGQLCPWEQHAFNQWVKPS